MWGYRIERLRQPSQSSRAQLTLQQQAGAIGRLAVCAEAFDSAPVPAAMARHLASIDCWELSSTRNYLAGFMERTTTVLEAVAVRNLLIRSVGSLVLADPVAEIFLPLD